MTHLEVMRASLHDELAKIAGELQGFTRSGRRPISVPRLLEQEGASEDTPSEVFKTSAAAVSPTLKTVGTLAAGAGLYHVARKMNQDRQLGRAMRLQQGMGT